MSRHARIDFDVLRRWNELTKRESHVYAFLVGCRNSRTGQCNPTRTQIAAGLGINLRDVWFGINGLIAAGWIVETDDGFNIVSIDQVSKKESKGFQNGNQNRFPKRKVEVSKKESFVSKKESRRNIVFKQTKQTIEQNTPIETIDAETVNKKSDALRVFDHWKLIHKKGPRQTFTDKRKKRVVERLKNYSVKDLFDAIEGCSKSPHHCGINDTGTVYNDLELICRSGDHVERFIELNERPRLRVVKPGDVGRSLPIVDDEPEIEAFEPRPVPDLPADIVAIWDRAKESIKGRLSAQVFDTWFRPLLFDGIDDGALLLRGRRYTIDWITRYYSDHVTAAIVDAGAFRAIWEIEDIDDELQATG